MRKIRNAAIAGLTAVSLVAGATTIATADTEASVSVRANNGQKPAEAKECPEQKDDTDDYGDNGRDCTAKDITDVLDKKNSSKSSTWSDRYNGKNKVYGTDLLGIHKNFSRQPVWAQIWYAVTVLGILGTVVGLGILPVFNDMKAKGLII